MYKNIDNTQDKEIDILEIINYIKIQRLFLNNPNVLIKKICECANSIPKNEIKVINKINYNLKNINKIMSDTEYIDYSECIKQCINIIHHAKQNNSPINMVPFDKKYEINLTTPYEKKNNLDLCQLVTSENLENYIDLFNFRSYGDFIQLYTVLDDKNKLIISFRQSDSTNDWIQNFKLQKIQIIDIFKKINEYFEVRNIPERFDIKYYENCFIHSGFAHGFFAENDSFLKNNMCAEKNLIEFLINLLETYEMKMNGNKQIILIGHSLGGAISVITSFILEEYIKLKKYDIGLKIITTGTPRIGNSNFIELYKNNIIKNQKMVLYRIIRNGDLVISMPLSVFGYMPLNCNIITNMDEKLRLGYDDNIGKEMWYIVKYTFRSFFVVINNILNIFNMIDHHDSLSYFLDLLKLSK